MSPGGRWFRKHGIDFRDCVTASHGMTRTLEDRRYDYDEPRFITIGLLDGTVIVIAHTEANRVIHIISARKASKYEEPPFFECC